MADIIRDRFPEKPRSESGEKAERPITLRDKQSEMLLFFYQLKKTDPAANYHKDSVELRRGALRGETDVDLEKKMRSGSPLLWKADPQWWYALEEELVARNRFLNEEWST